MPTVIDSLVMLLSLDNSGFKKGKTDAEKDQKDLTYKTNKTGQQAAAAGKQAAQFFTQLKREAVSFFAATAGGVGFSAFLSNMVNANAKLGLFAQNMGQDVSSVAAWQGAVERMGGSAEETQASIAGLSKAVAMFELTGDTGVLGYFRRFGIEFTNTQGKMRDITSLFRDFHKALIHDPSGRPVAYQAGLAAGLSPGLLNLLMQTDDEFEKSMKIQEDLYQTTKRDAEVALRFKQELTGIQQQLRAAVMPYLTRTLELLERFGRWMSDNKQLVTSFFIGLAVVLTNQFLPAILAFLVSWGLVPGLILLAAAALGLLIDDWWTWMNGGQAALGTFWQAFADGWHAVADRTRDIWDGLAKDWRDVLSDMGMDTTLFIKDLLLHDFDTAVSNMMKRVRKRIKERQGETGIETGGGEKAADEAKTGIRGLDNHNIFNLEYRGQKGARREDHPSKEHTFAAFENDAAGTQAFRNQLELWFKRDGVDSIRKFVASQLGLHPGQHTPEEMAYIKSLGRLMGKGADDKIDTKDENVVREFMRAIATHESGRKAGDIVANTPTTANGQSGARASLAAAGVTVPKAGTVDTNNMRSTNETTIGKIEIYTQAKDAIGIARSMSDALKNKGVVYQADQGLSP